MMQHIYCTIADTEYVFMVNQVRDYINAFKKERKFNRVLEVGSREVNGKIRDLFEETEYIGIDMIAGDGVDKVINGHDLESHFTEGEFDLVLCLETLEHDEEFWETVKGMKWVLKKGGWLIITMPGTHHSTHDWPGDYWRPMRDGFNKLFEDLVNVSTEYWISSGSDQYPDGWMGRGQKI